MSGGWSRRGPAPGGGGSARRSAPRPAPGAASCSGVIRVAASSAAAPSSAARRDDRLAELVPRGRADEHAPVGPEDDEAERVEPAQRLADRCAAHAVLLGELLLAAASCPAAARRTGSPAPAPRRSRRPWWSRRRQLPGFPPFRIQVIQIPHACGRPWYGWDPKVARGTVEGARMRIRTTGTRFGLAAVTALVIAGAGCGGSDSGGSGGGGSSSASGTPQSGGSVIDRPRRRLAVDGQDHRLRQRVDLGVRADHGAAVHGHQGRQGRRAVAGDGLHDLRRQADLHVQAAAGREVLQRPADDVRRRQVLDRRGPKVEDRAGASSTPRSRTSRRRDPTHGRDQAKYPWAPLLADLALFTNGIIPKDYGGKTQEEFYKAPIGTGPFMWDHWDKGSELTLKKNPNYWQKGKPYLDSVTWTDVPDDNTRKLQLQGGQVADRRVPAVPARSTSSKNTPGVKMTLFPSTRTDYMMINERYEAVRGRARAPRDLATPSTARPWSRRCCSATARRRTRSCRRRCRSTTRTPRASSSTWTKAKQEMAQSTVPERLHATSC